MVRKKTKPRVSKRKPTVTKTKKPKPKPKPKKATTRKPSKPQLATLTTTQAKRKMGGSFPNLNGRKHKYPHYSNDKAWTLLVTRAIRMKERDKTALDAGRVVPVCKLRSKYQYLLYHCGSHAKWKRATRNNHRKRMGLRKGDPRVVHHEDQRTMSFASAKIMNECQHKRAHGAECIKSAR